jgi:hypothetical protein
MKDEAWKPVVGWEGLYEVSSLGRVKSLPKYIPSKLKNQCGGFWRNTCILKSAPDSHGHLVVVLCNRKLRRTVCVHHLVAESFNGIKPLGFDVHHLNENRQDNRHVNLAYLPHGSHTTLHAEIRREHARVSG